MFEARATQWGLWRAAGALLCCLVMLPAGESRAQGYPSKPIKLVVPNPPGGSSDIVARQLATGLSSELGQPVVIENRAGASGMVAAQFVAAAPADGYTLLFASTSVMAMNPVTFAKVPYDPQANFTPVTLLTTQPIAIAVRADHPAKTLTELLDMARARPGQLNFASTGAAAALPFLYLQHQAGVKTTTIPYAGAGPAAIALLGGQVDVLPITLGTIYPHVLSGKVRVLAVTTPQRSPLAPHVATVAELGFPGFEASSWNGLAAPAGTPRDVVTRINLATIKVMSAPELQAAFGKDGTQVTTSSPERFGDHIRSELDRWRKVVKDSGMQPVAQ